MPKKKKLKGIKPTYHVLVVGCGGTGTFFLKEFTRFLAKNKEMQKSIERLVIADGDEVELKNLDRQCFLPEDIGRNKASVFAEILNDELEDLEVRETCRWKAIPSYIVSMDGIKEALGRGYAIGSGYEYCGVYACHIPLIISCVDNNGARLLLEDYFNSVDNCFLYDSGNEFSTGEVNFAHRLMGKTISFEKSASFLQLKNGDNRQVTEMSCEELNNSAPQHFLTNMVAAQHLLRGCINLFRDENEHLLRKIGSQLGYIFFDAFSGVTEFYPRINDSREEEHKQSA